jgi:hypothetical protein
MADSPAPMPKSRPGSFLRAFRSPGRNRQEQQEQQQQQGQAALVGAVGIPEGSGGDARTSEDGGAASTHTLPRLPIIMARSGSGQASAAAKPQKNKSTPALSKYLNAMDHEETAAVTPGGGWRMGRGSRGWLWEGMVMPCAE